MVDFGIFRALALACALIVAFASPLAATESDQTDPTTEETGGLQSYDKLLAAALDSEPAARGALQSAGGHDLLSDGLLDLHKFFVKVPDGTYRLTLLTDAMGNVTLASPLGDTVMVNGLRIPILSGGSDTWLDNGVLVLGGTQNAGGARGSGGATVITVEVIGGQLMLEFLPEEGQNIFLSGIILEPIEDSSGLATSDVFTDIEEIFDAEAIIAEAIGAALENIATAAGGDEGAVDDIINVDKVATEEIDAVSPS